MKEELEWLEELRKEAEQRHTYGSSLATYRYLMAEIENRIEQLTDEEEQ